MKGENEMNKLQRGKVGELKSHLRRLSEENMELIRTNARFKKGFLEVNQLLDALTISTVLQFGKDTGAGFELTTDRVDIGIRDKYALTATKEGDKYKLKVAFKDADKETEAIKTE